MGKTCSALTSFLYHKTSVALPEAVLCPQMRCCSSVLWLWHLKLNHI